MASVVTEVKPDGSKEIIKTSKPSNYELKVNQYDGELPQAPPTEDLELLFEPRYELEVKAPNGKIIPFYCKRIDPATMMITYGSPIAISTALDAEQIQNRMVALSENTNPRNEDGSPNQEYLEELQDILKETDAQAAMQQAEQLQINVIQAGVISPKLTKEQAERLSPKIKEALYQIITGGVTSQNELVEHFRDDAEAEEE